MNALYSDNTKDTLEMPEHSGRSVQKHAYGEVSGKSLKKKTSSSSVIYIREHADEDIQFALSRELNLDLYESSNFRDACGILEKRDFAVYFLDIEMTCKDDYKIVEILKNKKNTNPEIIVTVPSRGHASILDLLDRGITNFIRLPVVYNEFCSKIRVIIDKVDANNTEKSLIQDNSELLRRQLEWMSYKEIKRNIGHDTNGKNMVVNLRDSLVQAGGFGVMLSMVDVMKDMSEKKDDKYIVDSQIFEILHENSAITVKYIEGINKSIEIMSKDHEIEYETSARILSEIPEIMKDVIKDAKEGRNRFYFPQNKGSENVQIRINKELLSLALEELAVNAVKYSRPGSPIQMFATVSGGFFCLSVKNECDPKNSIQFPENATEYLVKPFLRMHPAADRMIHAEKIGMGLGLTTVQYITGQMNGLFNISEVQDHTGDSIKKCILSQIFLPVKI